MDDCELARGFYSNNDTLVDDCPGGVGVPCACWGDTHVGRLLWAVRALGVSCEGRLRE